MKNGRIHNKKKHIKILKISFIITDGMEGGIANQPTTKMHQKFHTLWMIAENFSKLHQ